jgi:Tol biopolymer transport system component
MAAGAASALSMAYAPATAVADTATRTGSSSTTRISEASDGTQGNGPSYLGGISANGRYVTYYSDASNLVPGDTNNGSDVFLHDRWTRRTTRISAARRDRTPGNSLSVYPVISADGRYVAYYSAAWDPVRGGTYDVVRHDRWTRHTTGIAIASYGAQASGYSSNPEISADGRYTAYVWDPPGLKPGETDGQFDVFLYRHS